MTNPNVDIAANLERARWACMNLLMQIIRAEECVTTFQEELRMRHMTSIEDRVEELGTELDVLRNLPTWPDADSVLEEE